MPESLRFLKNTFGPIQYIDPQYLEILNTIGKNKSSDIFSLGIILWEISSGNPPFEMESLSNVDLLNNIAKGKRETVIPGTPPKYKEIYTGINLIIYIIYTVRNNLLKYIEYFFRLLEARWKFTTKYFSSG
jgi:serine/threonine protein kinase